MILCILGETVEGLSAVQLNKTVQKKMGIPDEEIISPYFEVSSVVAKLWDEGSISVSEDRVLHV